MNWAGLILFVLFVAWITVPCIAVGIRLNRKVSRWTDRWLRRRFSIPEDEMVGHEDR